MNVATYVYIVHSDINENNIYAEFATEEEAIDYARRHKDELTYVDKVDAALDEDGEIIEMFDSETIWVYDEEDDFELEEEINEFDIAFEDEHPLDEGINLRNDAEREEFWRLCDEIGIYTANDLIRFRDEVGCTDENILQALRDYRAELGPDFKIADPELEREMAKKYEDIDFDGLVEELEEHEDMVECKECYDLVAKESCHKNKDGKYVCEKCAKDSLTEDTEKRLYAIYNDGYYIGDLEAESEKDAISKCYNGAFGFASSDDMFDAELIDDEVFEETIKMTKDELMDKEGTDDVELINAGRPEEERVELVEDGLDPHTVIARVERWLENKDRPLYIFNGPKTLEEITNYLESKEISYRVVNAKDGYVESNGDIIIYVANESRQYIPELWKDPAIMLTPTYGHNVVSAYDFNTKEGCWALDQLVRKMFKKFNGISADALRQLHKTYKHMSNTALGKTFADCETLSDVIDKLDPYFDFAMTKSLYHRDVEFYDKIINDLPDAIWEVLNK